MNYISWNPINPNILISVSDDETIRIWAPDSQLNRKKTSEENKDDSFIVKSENSIDDAIDELSSNMHNMHEEEEEEPCEEEIDMDEEEEDAPF